MYAKQCLNKAEAVFYHTLCKLIFTEMGPIRQVAIMCVLTSEETDAQRG